MNAVTGEKIAGVITSTRKERENKQYMHHGHVISNKLAINPSED